MRYEVAKSFAYASELLLAEPGKTMVLAGGTDVLVQLKLGLSEPDLLVDIKQIAESKSIEKTSNGYRIGAAVSGAALGENQDICGDWPGVVEAMELIGSTQIQGRATLVGNLCNASPAADSVPALMAAGASVEVVSASGVRQILVKDLPKSPGKTVLAKGDIISAVLLPPRLNNAADAYLRFIPRTEMDIAVASAGVNLELDVDGIVRNAQVALGAVAATISLVKDASTALLGSKLDDASLKNLAAACAAACSPINDRRGTIEFRTKIAGVLACRAAKIAYQRAGGSQ